MARKSKNDAGAETGSGLRIGDAILNGTLAPMTRERITKALEILLVYKKGKTALEGRIIENDKWFKMRQWEVIKEKSVAKTNIYDIQPKSGWLFNVLMGKQADMIEAYPEPSVLPRESGDKEEAGRLTSVVPVILEQNGFDDTYSRNSWGKNTMGGCIYGILYDHAKLNGLGDVAITKVDPLCMYWEPGIEDVQDSRNLFFVSLADRDVLQERFPDINIPMAGDRDRVVEQYKQEDPVDVSEKVLVIDWYYKKMVQGRPTLQLCQFTGDQVLYATEDDQQMGMRGLYDDGDYPYVFDPLFTVPGSLWGMGFVDIAKSSQEMIDLLGQQILKNAIMGATPRHFMRKDGAVNEEEFSDYTKPFVHVNGEITPNMIQPINVPLFSPAYLQVLQHKIEEIKFVTGNQDVMNGGISGSTAASAIMAQMEAAGRSSKAAIKASYRAYTKLVLMVIERIRQFYDMPRQFRIIGQAGQQKYIEYTNQGIQPQAQGNGIRKPLFDITVKAAKQTAYSRLAQNELVLDLFNRGFFSPPMADQAVMALELMEFDGKDEAIQKIMKQQQTLMMLQQYQQLALALTAKYEPQMNQGLLMQIQQQQAMMGQPQTLGAAPLPPEAENKMGLSPGVKAGVTKAENAGQRASQASQP